MDAHLSGDMQRALARIPERQRAALLLAELHDLTGVELAAALGVSHVAARALLTRARESLRQALAAERAAEAEAEAKATTSPLGRGSPMSRLHRLRRRAGPAAITPRSRPESRGDSCRLAARSQRTPPGSDAHLASCESCRSVAAAYRRTVSRCAACATSSLSRLATCGLGPPPPSRANRRHAAAHDEELRPAGARSRSAPCRGSRSSSSSSVPASCRAGSSPDARATPKGATRRSPSCPRPAHPGATPMAVGAGSVEWLGTSSTGGLAYSSTKIDKVCPADRQPDCEPVNDRDSKQVDLSIRPKSISQSPVKNQAVVVGTDAAGSDSVVVMALPTPQPTSTPVPSSTPEATATPSLTPEPTETPVASDRPRRAPNRPSPLPSSRVRRRRSHRPPRSSHRSNHQSNRHLKRPRSSRPNPPCRTTWRSSRGSRSSASRRRIRPTVPGSRSPRARRTARKARISTSGASATSSPRWPRATTPASSHRGQGTG